jgi:hypothetical protein
MNCQICGKEVKNLTGISSHIKQIHGISAENYYLEFLGERGICQECGCETNFISISSGYHKFCSRKCSNNSKENKEKIKDTCLKKYGKSHVMKVPEIIERSKNTFLSKYGVNNPAKIEDVKRRIKETCLERFGTCCSLQSPDVIIKSKITILKNFGVVHPLKSKKIQNKRKEKSIFLYGVDYPTKLEEVKNKIAETKRIKFFQRLLTSERLLNKVIPLFTLNDYTNTMNNYFWKCSKCDNIFEDDLRDGHIPKCKKCYPPLISSSIFEKEVSDFCKQYFPNLIEHDRIILDGFELDIYIPEINLAIECDGLYWHSELNGKNPFHHSKKTEACTKKGIHLIHIFEDEWYNKQDIIESILLAKMGKIENKIYARKCEIKEIKHSEASVFLLENHLQGPINGRSLGLIYLGELVSLITVGKPRFSKKYNTEILRFCNKKNTLVVGGLGKLIKRVNGQIITYNDLRYSIGRGYQSVGFELVSRTTPGFFYVKNNARFSRLQFQKHKLPKILENFDSNMTEWENMQLNGYDRIWDCGNLVFKKENNSD